jgi:DNA-binding beta-propeller fold protein YncE
MALSPDGKTVYVSGSIGLYVYATIAYDAATGARRWVRQYRRPGVFAIDILQVAVGPRGHTVYVTGAFGHDIVTLAYDAAAGARKWISARRGEGISLAVSPVTGTVFVTGVAHRAATADDYITIAYHG